MSISSISIKDVDEICQQYLTILYHHAQAQGSHLHKRGDLCETYGEVLFPSVEKLLSLVTLNEQDVFVDFGSGLGKMVVQVFLKSAVKEAYGIEIVPELHQQAMHVAQRVQHELPCFFEHDRQLTFVLGSFIDIPITTATVAMIVATCFTQSLLNALGQCIEEAASIHTVFSLRPIRTLRRLTIKKIIRLECSWDSTLCYIYQK